MAGRVRAQEEPIQALLRRYVERRGLSISELSRRTARSRRAIHAMLNGESLGIKPYGDRSLFPLLVRELEIPDREVRRALAAHSANTLFGALQQSKRASKTWYTQPAAEQRDLSLVAGF